MSLGKGKNMKKSLFITACLCLCLLCGCGRTEPSAAGEPPAAEGQGSELKITQSESVKREKYIGEADFEAFLSRSEKKYLIPGLNEAIIPQGMSLGGESGLLYISGYYKADGVPSVIMAVDPQSGELAAAYRLFNADGTPFVSHVGGLAAAGDRLFVSAKLDNDGSYSIASIALDKLPQSGSADVSVEETITLPVSPSFMSYSNGMLMVGNFYHPSADYGISKGMDFTTPTADGESGCYILCYDLSREDAFASPDMVLVAPDRIQGTVMLEDGRVFLSQSYGRKNNSTIFCYDLDTAAEEAVELDGQQVKAYILDSRCQLEAITAMPMTEALADDGEGNVLVLFESGAMAYDDGKFRTDHVWLMK